jgi:hypothetical protein
MINVIFHDFVDKNVLLAVRTSFNIITACYLDDRVPFPADATNFLFACVLFRRTVVYPDLCPVGMPT